MSKIIGSFYTVNPEYTLPSDKSSSIVAPISLVLTSIFVSSLAIPLALIGVYKLKGKCLSNKLENPQGICMYVHSINNCIIIHFYNVQLSLFKILPMRQV